MTPEEQEAQWRNRFVLINLTRIGATIVCLLGLLLWQSNMFVQGGSWVGFPVALIGVVASFYAPKYLARQWRTPPEP